MPLSRRTRFSSQLTLALMLAAVLAACGGNDNNAPPAATSYSIGGSVTGLATGASVVLQDNGADSLSVSANGAFTFATKIASGGAYAVTVSTQPAGQTCAVTGGSGTAAAAVTGVAVACTSLHTVAANVTGLGAGLSLTLQDNGADNESVTASGVAKFATAVATGKPYAVTVLTQPTNQTCTASKGSGTVASANVTVGVNCVYNSSNASLDGAYTTVAYEINTGASVPAGIIGTQTFDGNGNSSFPTGTVNLNGTVVPNAPVSQNSTYNVAADGTQVTTSSVIAGGIIGRNDNAAIALDLTAGDQPLMAIALKAGSGLSTASLAGNFTFVQISYSATAASGDLATVTFDSAGNATGTYIANSSGVISTGVASTNPLTVASNGALTAADASTVGALSADTNLAVWGDDLSGDEPIMAAGVRTGSTMTLPAVSGQYTGVDYNGQLAGGFAGASGTVASVILDGNGNFSGTSTNNTAGTISSGAASGTYTVKANGTMTLQGANGGGNYQGAVSVDGNSIVLANVTSGNAPEILVLFRQ